MSPKSNLKLLICFTVLMLSLSENMANRYTLKEWELTWTDAGDSTDFVFRTKLASGANAWTAFALSDDQYMVG